MAHRTLSSSPGFGLIGVGMIADFHARAITQIPGARLAGVTDCLPERCQAFCARHGVPYWTPDTDELVRRPDIDIVCVTTPSGIHLGPALAAIRAGKHVVIEKPLEITTERADEIIAAADAAGVQIAPIFQGRFGDGARTVKAALEAGRLGRIVLASNYVKWHRTAQYYTPPRGLLANDGGGAVMAQAIHGIDLLLWFVGLPAEVFAWKTRRVHTGIEVEDTAAAAFRFADGALGCFEASTALWPGWSRRHEICGEHGSIVLEDDAITRWEFRAPLPGDDAIRAAGQSNALGSGASNPSAISTEGHRRQLQDFVEALRAGRAPALNGREGRKAVALVRAIYESAERGAPVRLTVP
ncbi:MAG: Gfo/Idh/MocA family oxidoreductase [Verrucomicrobia bacterium]|nr:Gfo/Idh/MocA family oxidoreductase [Verrucomicrobiota bacterium]